MLDSSASVTSESWKVAWTSDKYVNVAIASTVTIVEPTSSLDSALLLDPAWVELAQTSNQILKLTRYLYLRISNHTYASSYQVCLASFCQISAQPMTRAWIVVSFWFNIDENLQKIVIKRISKVIVIKHRRTFTKHVNLKPLLIRQKTAYGDYWTDPIRELDDPAIKCSKRGSFTPADRPCSKQQRIDIFA